MEFIQADVFKDGFVDWALIAIGFFLILDGIVLYLTGDKLVGMMSNFLDKLDNSQTHTMDGDAKQLTHKVVMASSWIMIGIGLALILWVFIG